MNNRFKWKFTKATFTLLLTAIFGFLGVSMFGMNELTQLYGQTGFFSYTNIHLVFWDGLKASFNLANIKFAGLQLAVISLLLFLALMIVLCMLFRLKISNLYALLLCAIGGAAMLAVTTYTFVMVSDPTMFEYIKKIMLFKEFDFKAIQTNYGVLIQSIGCWLAALCLVGLVVEFIVFMYYGIREAINKVPHLKGEEKYFYKHFDKEELAHIATSSSTGGSKVYIAPRPRRGVRNNITVTRGMPMPERSTNVVQFVNCDDTFVDEIKSKQEKTKGATFIEMNK